MATLKFFKICSLLSLSLAFVSATVLTVPARAGEEACKVSCIDPHHGCDESAKVVEVVKELTNALASGNLEKAAPFFDEHCTTFDKGSHKMITGKEAVLKDIQTRLILHNPNSQEPLKAYTIDHPYAFVHGDTATVTFVAYKEYGGAHPSKMKSQCTDIFVKRGDQWKKLHYRSDWKRVKM
ncbi:MAG: DUF4440 domain-containing protein [Leptolyngbya sp.]|nr:DUF4440 domain-containing protein [Candidatus Melainabacteria bacterium]